MKLLTSLFPRGSKVVPSGGWFTLFIFAALIGLEFAGRQAVSDLHDGLAAFFLMGLGVSVAIRHHRDPLPWVRSLGAWSRRMVTTASWLRYEHGLDLRGTPPLPRRTPRVVWFLALGLSVCGALAMLSWEIFPTGWRVIGTHSSYVIYLAALLALWASLLFCIVVGVYVPVAMIDRWLKGWLGDTDRRGAELAAVVGYFLCVSLIAWTISPAAIFCMVLLVALGSLAAYLPKGLDTAALLWRSGPEKPICAIPMHRVAAVVIGLAALLAFNILAMSCGGRLFAPPSESDTMPVTALLGAMAAWLLPGLLVLAGARVISAWRNDPARRTAPAAHVCGGDLSARSRAMRLIRNWGWNAQHAPNGTEGGSVGVQLVAPEESQATEFDPNWPLKVCEADLQAGAVKQRLARRDEIRLRRQFFRGLSKLFKRACGFKGPNGGGFWLAPHWWFIEGIGREEAESGSDDNPAMPMVGPPFSRTLPPRARQHVHAVLRSTHVDMIFVEDGVSFRKVEKVLRVLMELYDVHGGTRRAEELHFRGLPKVKVMVHDYEPGNPFQSDVYPEPKFDDLSRVRVLHVFRDRGGHEERIEPPYDFSWTPAPALMS